MHFARLVTFVGAIVCLGCRPQPPAASTIERDRVTQFSIINALMLGHYDGVATIGQVRECGDFGVGTFDHLDGELIVLDGKVYQGLADGKVREAPATMTTPFAVVTTFDRDGTLACPAVGSLNELDAKIDCALPGQSVFYAIRVDGTFTSLTLRSVPRQEPPYRPLVEVAKQQSMWTHENVSGTMIGMRSPPWTDKLNVPGYHWHFVSDDRQMGGHVIDCKIESATITYDESDSWLIKLPGSQAQQAGDLIQDLSRELKEVESKRER